MAKKTKTYKHKITRTARIGSNTDGSPRINVTLGDAVELTAKEVKHYKLLNLIK